MSVIIEDENGWGVSFTSHNPEPEDFIQCASYDDADKLHTYLEKGSDWGAMMKKEMARKPVTPEEIKEFIQNKLVYINRTAGEIEYRDKNGNNLEEEFADDVYEAINKAVLAERKRKLIVY